MLLNPTLIDEPGSSRLHMLFRATGPWPRAQREGQPLPFPIFLGYAYSDDQGVTWQADYSRPCLAPKLAIEPEEMRIQRRDGTWVTNYANGCVEDPRLFRLDGKLYCTTANRMFPPGAYWEGDKPMCCAPAWAGEPGGRGLGRAATENLTVTTLWEVDLEALKSGDYDRAFFYVTHLSDPARGDNRDVFLFPEKLNIGGRPRYVCLHRPMTPVGFGEEYAKLLPSIFLAVADRIEDLATDKAEHRLLAKPEFPWEANRVGASWVPIALGNGEWLLPYHAKQDAVVGYTQSFMILAPGADGWPEVKHRCSDRLLYARKRWELEGRFKTPCVFTCGGVVRDGQLIMTYGAADNFAGVAWADYAELLAHLRRFDANGAIR
jgi:beta-1,2-mannobiose phosphorylase / 1,2-beta-oligomannan phosphorylase